MNIRLTKLWAYVALGLVYVAAIPLTHALVPGEGGNAGMPVFLVATFGGMFLAGMAVAVSSIDEHR